MASGVCGVYMSEFRKGDLVVDRIRREETGIVLSTKNNLALIYWVNGAGHLWTTNDQIAPHPRPEAEVLDEMFEFGD